MNGDNGKASVDATYFDSFGIEHIPKKIQKFLGNKNIMANTFRIQAYDSLFEYFYWIYWFYVE